MYFILGLHGKKDQNERHQQSIKYRPNKKRVMSQKCTIEPQKKILGILVLWQFLQFAICLVLNFQHKSCPTLNTFSIGTQNNLDLKTSQIF